MKKGLAIILPLICVSLCSCFNKYETLAEMHERLERDYGTIKLLLAHSDDASKNWVTSSKYQISSQYPNEKVYDTNREINDLLFHAKYQVLQNSKAYDTSDKTSESVCYNIPFDDGANITIRENGFGELFVCPDLDISLQKYILFDDRELVKTIIEKVDLLIESFLESKANS